MLGEGRSAFSSKMTLGVPVTPGQESWSGVADQQIMDATVFLCVLIFGNWFFFGFMLWTYFVL